MTDIRIIGTSHIAKESIERTRAEILSFKPDIVAVELDKNRYESLISKEKTRVPFYAIFKIGVVGYIFAKLGSWGSKKLGEVVGVSPGDEMLTAITEARKNNIKVALIDQPIEITLARFSKSITWKEKCNFIVDIFRSIFFRKRIARELGLETLDLRKVPSNKIIISLMNLLKKRYPNVYKVLVFERNIIMVNNILSIINSNPNSRILVFVGAGHVQGMVELIRKIKVTLNKHEKKQNI